MRMTPEEFRATEERVMRNRGLSMNQIMSRRPEVKAAARRMERESDLHDAIIRDVKSRGWFFVHSAMHKATRQTVGTPDFIIAGDKGKTFWVEAKIENRKETPEQAGIGRWLKKFGHSYHVVRSLEEYLEVVS